jgi:hypothetical protein
LSSEKKAIHQIKVKVLKDYRAMDSVKTIIQLRRDANLRYLNQDEYSGKGRPRKYGAKVDLTDYSNFELVAQLSPS